MFILPYILPTRPISSPPPSIHTFLLLLIGGKALWEEDTKDIERDVLQPNGFTARRMVYHNDIMFCELEPTGITFSDYYHWNEVSTEDDRFCWRPFYWVGSLSESSWLPPPASERLGSFSTRDLLSTIASMASETTPHTS